MARLKWQIILGVSLVVASAMLYIAQIMIFHSTRDTFFYLLQDIAFIPIQVLLVTLILNQLLNIRERQSMLNKMNMVIGTFFSEVGSLLLKSFAAFDGHAGALGAGLQVQGTWSDQQCAAAIKQIRGFDYDVRHTNSDLSELKSLLMGKRDFLLRLLEKDRKSTRLNSSH